MIYKQLQLAAAAVLLFALTDAASGQPAPKFEVASIRPQPPERGGNLSVGVTISGNRLSAEHVSLEALVEFAYDLRDFQVSGGPAWTRSDDLYDQNHFVLNAKAPGDAVPTRDQFKQMMRALLADRFQLEVRMGKKDVPVYNLVIAKGGPKLTASAADAQFKLMVDAKKDPGIQITAAKETIAHFANTQLSHFAGRPILDKTGLTGYYDFKLEWVQEDPGRPVSAAEAAGAVSLLTVVQEQLGLKLESATAPYDAVTIIRAERPTEN